MVALRSVADWQKADSPRMAVAWIESAATSRLWRALLESVEPIVQVLDDVLRLGRREFLFCHVAATFQLLL